MAWTKEKTISFEELTYVEDMLSLCASGAIRNARLGKNWKEGIIEIETTDIEDEINLLMRCYMNSMFSLKYYDKAKNTTANNSKKKEPCTEATRNRSEESHQAYQKYIRKNFIACMEEHASKWCMSKRHLRLILPIIFFSLILQNESNSESVFRRALKIDIEGEDSNPWKCRNPYKLSSFKINNNSKDQRRFQNEISSLEAYVTKIDFYGHPMFSDNVMESLNCAFRLADDYEKIVNYSEHARIGLFLCDLLETFHDKANPLDTVLRMYMVTQMLEVFSVFRTLISSDLHREANCAGLLTWFFTDKNLMTIESIYWQRVQLEYKGNLFAPDTKSHLDKDVKQRNQFSDYYRYLRANFVWELDGFIEFFLNKKALTKYAGADQKILDYVKAMKHMIKEIPKMEPAYNNADTISELDNICALTR